jgi:LysM repeat protein
MHQQPIHPRQRNHRRLRLHVSFVGLVILSIPGCGPAWYSPPPPMYPAGQRVPPGQLAPVPRPPGSQQHPLKTPSTFEHETLPGSLNEVPSVPADQVLTVPPPLAIPTYHEVKAGETLIGIAKVHGVTLGQLRAANTLRENHVIKPYDLLRIPD